MERVKPVISEDVFTAYLHCKYKSYLKLHHHTGHKNDYEAVQACLDNRFRQEAQRKLRASYPEEDVLHLPCLTPSALRSGKALILDTSLELNGLKSSFDGLKRRTGESRLGPFHYQPILFCRQLATSTDKVYYFYRQSREGAFLKELLQGFAGVLISDLYGAYDSLNCPQQKCLLHLLRDVNDDLLRNPFDGEFKVLAQRFAILLRTMIDTVDRYGLKKRHLHRHKRAAVRFIDSIGSQVFSSEVAQKYQNRFMKNGMKLFTFLDYNGVPWNNNNAEHALKRFAKYRRFADGCFTQRSIQKHLVILSVFETCEYNNVNVLRFLLSKQKELQAILG